MSDWWTDWTEQARCAEAGRAGSDPDAMFVRGAAQREVREVCFACPVRMECLVEAFECRIEFGVWGGFTERERRAMVRRAPRETDWRATLTQDAELAKRFEHERRSVRVLPSRRLVPDAVARDRVGA